MLTVQTLKVQGKKKPVGIAKALARWNKGSKGDMKALQNLTAEDAEVAMNPIDIKAEMANIDEAVEDFDEMIKVQT